MTAHPIAAWLAAESDRLWLLGERALRTLHAATRPISPTVETMLAARPPRTDHDLARVEATLGELRRTTPIGRLVATFALRPAEVEVLVVAVATQLDASLGDLWSALRGSRAVDLALVAMLFRLGRADRLRALAALDPDRPLVRWQLLELGPRAPSDNLRLLHVPAPIVATLCGATPAFAPAPASLADLHLDADVRRSAQAMCDAAGSPALPWLVLWGPAGVGKRTLAARIAAHAKRPLIAVDPAGDLVAAQRDAMLHDALLYLGPIPDDLPIVAKLADYRGRLALGFATMQPPHLATSHPVWELALRLPTEPTRLALWTERLPEVDVAPLARAFNLTAGEIVESAREATAVAACERTVVTHAHARAAVSRRLRTDLGELARPIEVTATWNDLVLPDEDMERVHEFIARKQFAHQVYGEWGYGARVGGGKGLIAMFSGPPGTGKTMLAGIIARALELDLYQVDLGQVTSKWAGETEKQLGKVFDQAERAHAVLLFDEADSLFAKRTEVESSSDRYGNMAVNYLLQRLEQYMGIAVLTTNKDTSMDEALQRRLTLRLMLDVPEPEERARLWRSFLPARAPIKGRVDLPALADEFELSGGYIKNAAVRAAFLAASRGQAITMELLRLAAALELEDMGRVVWQRRLAA